MGSYYDPVLIKDKRQQLVELAGSICAACGTKGTVFEFDHIDPDTKAFRLTGSDMTRSWESLLNEFFKCQLLCLDCHKKKTSEERRVALSDVVHGLSSYTNRRCRCDICKKAHNVYMKMYKKAHSVR